MLFGTPKSMAFARSLIKPKTLTSLLFSSRSTASSFRSTALSSRSSLAHSFVCLLRPLSAVSTPYATSLPHRGFSTRATSSSLNDPNPNWSNRPPKETILLDGCDFEHWLVVMDPPEADATRDDIIQKYIKTLAQVVGSEEEARMKIYSVSTRCYFAFGALVSEELSYKIKELPNVRWVLPDSYLDVKNKNYGGEPFINGEAVPYDPKYHEEWIRNNARANERNRKNDRPRNHDRSRNFERRRENMQNRDFQNREPSMPNPHMQQTAPNQGGIPPNQGGMPPNQGVMPPTQGGMPPIQGGMPPNQGGMPPNQGGLPPSQGMRPPNMQNSDIQNRESPMYNQRMQQASPYQGGIPPPNGSGMPSNQGTLPPNVQYHHQNREPSTYNQQIQQAAPNQGTSGMPQSNMRGWTPNNMGGLGGQPPNNTGGTPQGNMGRWTPNNMGGTGGPPPNSPGGMPQGNTYGWTPNNMGGTGQPPNNTGGNTQGMPGVPQNNYGGPNNMAGFQYNSNFPNRDARNVPTYQNRDS